MSHDVTKAGVSFPVPRPTGPACLVTIYGRDLGKRWNLDVPSFILGRGETSNVVLDMENVSRRHCELRPTATGTHIVEDLSSRNGTFVNYEELKGPRELHNGDLIKVGNTIFKYLDGAGIEAAFHEEIYRMTIVDGLTQVYNKRYLLEFLEREIARANRYGRSLSLLMMDVDHFKRVNDTYGHIAGDHVLREVAAAVTGNVRKEECFARYGGEEFALVLPEAEKAKVLQFAEKIRRMVAERDVVLEGHVLNVTVSIGMAQLTAAMTDAQALLAAADERLYEAKRTGRNRVVA